MSKIDLLRNIRNEIDINISGSENINIETPSLFVSNHNCLMDIFYLPMSIEFPIVNMISARLIYKKNFERQKMINDYLYSMPIEAHGGNKYSNMCLNSGISLLNSGISLGIFPEGAYVSDNNIYRGRTGASRILYGAMKEEIDVKLIPVGINVFGDFDLDSYTFDERSIDVKILPSVDCKNFFDMFINSSNFYDKNEALHKPIDLCMKQIAEALDRPYINKYIELYPKGNVIFKDGYTVNTQAAQYSEFINKYGIELNDRVKVLKKEMARI